MIADDEIDAVYIATPVYLHAEQTVAAAEAGKSVLCEKPMAMNPDECKQMIAVCESQDVALGVAYYRRFYPRSDASRRSSRRARSANRSSRRSTPSSDSIRRRARNVIGCSKKSKSGGGSMMDFGCHRLEILLNLFGPIERTTSAIGRALFGREVEDTCVASLEFESGAQASVAVTHAAFESRDTLDIYCSAGSIHTAFLNRGEIRIVTAAGERIECHPPHANFHQPLIEDFTRAVLDGREPEVGGDVGRAVAMVVDEIYARGD